MKRKLLFIFMALVVMASTNINAQIAKEVEGSYGGTLIVTLEEGNKETLYQSIDITATGDTEVTLSINDFKFPMAGTEVKIGDIVVPGIKLEEENNEYAFTAEAKIDIAIIGATDLPLDIEGTINAEGILNLTIDIAGDIFVEFKDGSKIKAKEVEGSYDGTLTVILEDGNEETLAQSIDITATGNTEITLSINDFKFPMAGTEVKIGDIVVPGIKLKKENDDYVFAADAKIDIAIIGATDLPLDIEGTINAEGVLNLTIDIAGDIFVEFEGNKETNAIGTIKNNNKLVVFPSLSYDELNIEGLQNNTQYAIYNIAGLTIKKGFTQSTINISDLSKGIYIINIEGRSVKFVKK